MVFDLMLEQNLLKKGQVIYIQVDFTTIKDDFLILSASVIVKKRAVPLYFTIRNCPVCKNQYNHKKMESAFLKGLKHIFSSKYQYVIVADRGFGNERFINLCEENGFDYVIRIQPNMPPSLNGDRFKIEKLFQDLKSSGFDIEASKIKKYDRFKRLLAMCMVSHALLVFVGNFITDKMLGFLKNSPIIENVALAYFLLETKQYSYLQKENSYD